MNNKLGNIFKGDRVIWMIFLILSLVSIIEVFSASSFLTYKSGSYMGPMFKHSFYILIGLCAMIAIQMMPCKYFKIATFPMYLLSAIMLYGVLAFGAATNDAARWVDLGFVQFQPSEIAKGSLVLLAAQILSGMQDENGATKDAFAWLGCMSLVIITPIAVENFSTGFLISGVIFLMMFVGRVPLQLLGKTLGVAALGAMLAVASVMLLGEDKKEVKEDVAEKTELVDQTAVAEKEEGNARGGILHRMDTWKSRINKFFNSKYIAPEDYDLDKDAQVAHANIAIVNSNIIGRGPGNSDERDFLSQAFSDFIFAIIIEETGIEGAAIVAALYVIIFWRAGRIARKCANRFPAYLAMGIGMLLVFQAMFNMMVAVGLAPVTGQPLPLISKGGTSTIINCVYLGMLLSISRTAKKRENLRVQHA